MDHNVFPGNSSPTPPLSQHQVDTNVLTYYRLGQNVGLGEGAVGEGELLLYLKSIHNRPAVMIPSQPCALNPFSHMTGTMDLDWLSA